MWLCLQESNAYIHTQHDIAYIIGELCHIGGLAATYLLWMCAYPWCVPNHTKIIPFFSITLLCVCHQRPDQGQVCVYCRDNSAGYLLPAESSKSLQIWCEVLYCCCMVKPRVTNRDCLFDFYMR